MTNILIDFNQIGDYNSLYHSQKLMKRLNPLNWFDLVFEPWSI